MKMTNEEYKRYAERRAPRSQTGGNMLRAFCTAGRSAASARRF